MRHAESNLTKAIIMTKKISILDPIEISTENPDKIKSNLFRWLIKFMSSKQEKLTDSNSRSLRLGQMSTQQSIYPARLYPVHEKSFMDEAMVEYVTAIVLVAQVQDMEPNHELNQFMF